MVWRIEDVPDLSGKTIVVIGASTGVGFHSANIFARKKARVVLASHIGTELKKAANEIRNDAPEADLVEIEVDMADLDSVRAFAHKLEAKRIDKIDVLLLNAGITSTLFRKSPQGYELTFATNHLGHWLLAGLLLKHMRDVPDSRIITVSSLYHHEVKKIDYEQAKGKSGDKFDTMNAYAQTKFANHLLVQQLNKKLRQAGAKTVAVACHPGISNTPIYDSVEPKWLAWLMRAFIGTFFLSAEGGSLPLVMAVTDRGLSAESYYGPSGFLEGRGAPHGKGKRNAAVFDEGLQEELWSVSEKLCDFSYDI